jgi:hypothetical protein
MLEIPGYVYDETTNRYYKDSSNRKKAPPDANEKLQKLKLVAAKRSDNVEGRPGPQKTLIAEKVKKPLLALHAKSPVIRFYDAVATSRLPAGHIDRLRQCVLSILIPFQKLTACHANVPVRRFYLR